MQLVSTGHSWPGAALLRIRGHFGSRAQKPGHNLLLYLHKLCTIIQLLYQEMDVIPQGSEVLIKVGNLLAIVIIFR